MQTKYKYTDPKLKGYVKAKVSLRDLYKIGVGNRGRTLFIKAVVFFHPTKKDGIIEYRLNLLGKLVLLLLMPASILLDGLPETIRSTRRDLFQSKFGSFSTDTFSPPKKSPSINSKIIEACERNLRKTS